MSLQVRPPSPDRARSRGATIYAEVAGYGATSEAYNIMAPMVDGAGMANTMSKALKNASISPDEIDYINAHGTSTELNDRMETKALKTVLRTYSYAAPWKSEVPLLVITRIWPPEDRPYSGR